MCTRRHSLPELPGETVERFLRHAQGFETVIGECDAYPGVGQRACWVGCRGDCASNFSNQLTPGLAVVNAKRDVGGRVRRGPGAKNTALNVFKFKFGVR